MMDLNGRESRTIGIADCGGSCIARRVDADYMVILLEDPLHEPAEIEGRRRTWEDEQAVVREHLRHTCGREPIQPSRQALKRHILAAFPGEVREFNNRGTMDMQHIELVRPESTTQVPEARESCSPVSRCGERPLGAFRRKLHGAK